MKSALGWFISILTAAILGYGFVAFGFQTVYMVGPSMEPTLTDGESYLVNKAVYLVTSPERYDVVAYRIVENQDEYYSIKRVVGLPGETVLIQNGQVYINGNPLADYPVDCEIKTAGIAESAITLGENEYFLLGDNPDNSQDSKQQDSIHGAVEWFANYLYREKGGLFKYDCKKILWKRIQELLHENSECKRY